MRIRAGFLVIATAALSAATPRVAAAEPVVLAITGDKIYVDLGGEQGVGAGARSNCSARSSPGIR